MAKEAKEKKEKKPRVKKYDFKYLIHGNSMECSKCGKMKATRPDVYQKRLDAVDGNENKLANYLCQACRPKAEKKPKKEKKEKKAKKEKAEDEE